MDVECGLDQWSSLRGLKRDQRGIHYLMRTAQSMWTQLSQTRCWAESSWRRSGVSMGGLISRMSSCSPLWTERTWTRWRYTLNHGGVLHNLSFPFWYEFVSSACFVVLLLTPTPCRILVELLHGCSQAGSVAVPQWGPDWSESRGSLHQHHQRETSGVSAPGSAVFSYTGD